MESFFYDTELITVHIGQVFEINLDSQSTDADCAWSLSSMPQCLNLLDMRTPALSALYGGKREQVFSFLALSKNSSSNLEFSLLRTSTPVEIIQEKSISIIIGTKEELLEKELKEAAGKDKFVNMEQQPQGAANSNPPIYGAPMEYFNTNGKGLGKTDILRKITLAASKKRFFYSS